MVTHFFVLYRLQKQQVKKGIERLYNNTELPYYNNYLDFFIKPM